MVEDNINYAFAFDQKTGERLTEQEGNPIVGDILVDKHALNVVVGWSHDLAEFRIKYVPIILAIDE